MLGLCRGFQEMNVALGGTLHQHVQEVPGRIDHREDTNAPLETQYGPAHTVARRAGRIARAHHAGQILRSEFAA